MGEEEWRIKLLLTEGQFPNWLYMSSSEMKRGLVKEHGLRSSLPKPESQLSHFPTEYNLCGSYQKSKKKKRKRCLL